MATAIGSMTQNSPCHGRTSRSAPDTAGPSAGATDMTTEMRPMMRPRSCGATIVMTVVIMRGIMMAVPIAWTTRPTISNSKTGESAAMRVPTLKVDIATRKTGRVFNPLHQPPCDWDHDSHRQRERRREPLALGRVDAQRLLDLRQRDVHHRLVEEDDEDGREQEDQRHPVAGGQRGRLCVDRSACSVSVALRYRWSSFTSLESSSMKGTACKEI